MRVLAAENSALFPNVLSRVPYIHWFRTVKDTLVANSSLIVKFCLLDLLPEIGFLMSVVGRVP